MACDSNSLEKLEEYSNQYSTLDVIEILEMSDAEKLEDCIEHTTSKDILK